MDTNDTQIIKENEQLLNKHGWFFEIEENLSAENFETGCSINGELTISFLIEKIEEIKEEESDPVKYPDTETLLENYGYTAHCLSPFEVINNKTDDLFVGECANWLLSTLKERWRNTKN